MYFCIFAGSKANISLLKVGGTLVSIVNQDNYTLFVDINQYAGHVHNLDLLMVFCANYLIFCYILLLLWVWGFPLAWSKTAASARIISFLALRRATVIWTVVACLLSYVLNLTVEQFIYEPRPFVSHHVNLLASHAADGSFPSDHTAWAFAVIGMLFFCLLPRVGSLSTETATQAATHLSYTAFAWLVVVIALIMGCLIGFARVFIGVHYPGDIIGGVFSGLLAAGIATVLRSWLDTPTLWVLHLAQRLRLA
jgi:undecaprenyl-diphosphatase